MWNVGPVASLTEGWGFNITNKRGSPLVVFGYETRQEAEEAAMHAQAVVGKARMVRPLA
jgi:hypothetical protein